MEDPTRSRPVLAEFWNTVPQRLLDTCNTKTNAIAAYANDPIYSNILTRRERPWILKNYILWQLKMVCLVLLHNIRPFFPFFLKLSISGKRVEVNMQIRDQLVINFLLHLHSSVQITRDPQLQGFTYLLAAVEADFWGRGLAPRPRAERLPSQLSGCGALLSPSDEELNALWFDMTSTMERPCIFTRRITRSGRGPRW